MAQPGTEPGLDVKATGDKASAEPPPEKPADTSRRTRIVLSFWLLVLLLGLPFWWGTTAIYRAELPLDEMLQWADGKACKPVLALQISIEAPALQDAEVQHLLQLTQHALDDLNDFSSHHLRLQLAPRGDERLPDQDVETALTIHLNPGETTSASLSPHSPVLDIVYLPSTVPSSNAASSTLATYIANELRSTFAEEQTIISYLLSSSSIFSGSQPQGLTSDTAEALSRRTTRSLRYAPTFHLTFSLFTPGATPNSWEIETALEEYMQPMLDVLGPIHNFTIDTQVQLYATPGAQKQVLGKDDLASFINAAEWPLSPFIGGAPTVNFVVYIGNQSINLDTDAHTSQSWMIPQWGSVYLLSLPDGTSQLSSAALKEPMLTFGGHLLALLGTPQSGSLPLRLSTLSRIRSVDLLLQASSSLGSLARLSLALKSISIPRTVAEGVSTSLRHLERACSSLGSPSGLWHARTADEAAEKAFFEKSMVGQLYFPEEHKIAVYLPLLGPVGVPLIMGLVTEIKRWLQKRKQRAAAAAEKKRT